MTGWTRAKAIKVVRARSEGVCEICGWRRAACLSHRIAVSRGGTWAPSGLVHSCGSGTTGCHGWLEEHPTWAGEGGWHIRRTMLPAIVIPVFLRAWGWSGWVLLDDEGGRIEVDPAGYGLPLVPAHFPPVGRPLATVPWVDPR